MPMLLSKQSMMVLKSLVFLMKVSLTLLALFLQQAHLVNGLIVSFMKFKLIITLIHVEGLTVEAELLNGI